MNTRDVITRYYELANNGDWNTWCDLFAVDQVTDEQLAGHIEGRETLREMMKGFKDTYAHFANHPRHIVIDGEQAAVVSHITATTTKGQHIEAGVCNYFTVMDGQITYLANYHDSAPFASILAK